MRLLHSRHGAIDFYLLQKNPDPSDEEIRKGLEGNLCMCTGYMQIVEAVRSAAKSLKGLRTER